jgi:hypothetical protein
LYDENQLLLAQSLNYPQGVQIGCTADLEETAVLSAVVLKARENRVRRLILLI